MGCRIIQHQVVIVVMFTEKWVLGHSLVLNVQTRRQVTEHRPWLAVRASLARGKSIKHESTLWTPQCYIIRLLSTVYMNTKSRAFISFLPTTNLYRKNKAPDHIAIGNRRNNLPLCLRNYRQPAGPLWRAWLSLSCSRLVSGTGAPAHLARFSHASPTCGWRTGRR